jgi:hypothetical protein
MLFQNLIFQSPRCVTPHVENKSNRKYNEYHKYTNATQNEQEKRHLSLNFMYLEYWNRINMHELNF